MGGNAFPTLSTPRMSPAVYNIALSETEQKLLKLFSRAAHPIEGPEKADYGDLDILVLANPNTAKLSIAEIAEFLDAEPVASVCKGIAHFALPWPEPSQISSESKLGLPTINSNDQDIQAQTSRSKQLSNARRHIQLDLHIVQTPAELEWHLFNNAHGDFVNIISAILRPKGLTVTDTAFYVRIAELETQNRKLCRVELTRSPDEVLKYLGMDPVRFWRPFATRIEMYEYLCTCRLFDPKPLLHKFADSHTDSPDTPQTEFTLNKFDEQTRMTRPLFAAFFKEYLPSQPSLQPGSTAHLTRSELLEDIFTYFGTSIRESYYAQKHEVTTNLARTNLWTNIRDAIKIAFPDITDQDLHQSIKGLKRDILAIQGQPTPVQTAYTDNDFTAVIEWSVQHHDTSRERYRECLKAAQSQVVDESKTNKYSTKEAEVFTPADDVEIVALKAAGRSWNDIMAALGKSSRSQVVARWKELQNRSEHSAKS